MNATKVVITGGAGLVGQNLIVRLRERDCGPVVVIDKNARNLAVVRELHPEVTAVQADLAEHGAWEAHFAGAEVVVMLQAQIGAKTPEPFERNNLVSTRNVLETVKRFEIPYTVHVSSSVVNSVANDAYTRTKRDQERLVATSGIPCVVLRPTLMFGWFDRKHLGWLSRFMRRVPVFPVPGNGRFIRQPLYVGDFCNIIIQCIESRPCGGTYDITGLERVEYISIIRMIRQAVHARCAVVKVPYRLFALLLEAWALFDANPPFTVEQLAALVAGDEFDVVDWETIFGVKSTPFPVAIEETFNDSRYSHIVLEF